MAKLFKKDSKQDFQKRAKTFMLDFQILQNKHNIDVRPIITTFGPDFQLVDRLSKPAPVENKKV